MRVRSHKRYTVSLLLAAFLSVLALCAGAVRAEAEALLVRDYYSLFSEDEVQALDEQCRAFYEKNGLIDTGVRASVFGAAYRILVFPGQADLPDREDTAKLYRELYRTFLPNLVLQRMVRINYTDNKETP